MRGSFRSILILIAVPLAGMAIFFFWQWINGGITPAEVAREVPQALRGRPGGKSPHSVGAATGTPYEEPAEEALPKVRPRKAPRAAHPSSPLRGEVVLIIDDLGFDGQPLQRLMALDPNLNCSILPNGTRTAEFAETLHAAGFEILCHLPMEPRGNASPGRNAILTSMSDEEITRTTVENIAAIPWARGVNNHMGSLATSDRRVMEQVLRAIPEGLYFVDSRTSGRSIAGEVARELGVPTVSRQVFLDDIATEAFVRQQLAELVETAQEKGIAVGIGHPYPSTVRVLERELPRLKARGLRLIRASEAISRGTPEG
jgi:polysaccharide deacetylase 2 family uncharacterized protein YibQ